MFPFDTGLEPRIVFEDDRFLAVYKPPRLHTAPQRGGGECLAAWVFRERPAALFDPDPARGRTRRQERTEGSGPEDGRLPVAASEGGLFHRLDFETSGLVLFALDPEALASLVASQEAGLVEKTYRARASVSLAPQEGARPGRGRPSGPAAADWEAALAAAAGAVPDGSAGAVPGAALAELARLGAGSHVESRFRPFGPGGSRVACLAPGEAGPRGSGRRSHGSPPAVYVTELAAITAEPGPEGGLEIEARIRRGFRHQIRAQLAWIGLPLAGDPLYGGRPFVRLCLHAERLRFPHPDGGPPVSIDLAGPA